MRTFVLGFLGGVLFVLTRENLPLFLWWHVWPLLLLIVFFYFYCPRWRSVYFLIGGCVLGAIYSFYFAQNHLKEQLKEKYANQDMLVSGWVLNKPQKIKNGQRFLFQPENQDLPSKILVRWYENKQKNNIPQDLNAGDYLKLNLRLKKIHGFYNEGSWDYERRMLSEGIGASAYVRNHSRGNVRLENTNKNFNFFIFVERLRLQIEKAFIQILPEKEYPWVGILIALSIGEQNAIGQNEWNLFNQTAVTHLFSISGLHITFLSTLWACCLTFFWRQFPGCLHFLPAPIFFAVTAALVAFLYACLAGFGVPAQRTLYMLWAGAFAICFWRNIAPSQALAFALGVVLIYSPFSIFTIGFWLSFGTVAVLLFVGSSYLVLPAQNRVEKVKQLALVFWRTQWAASLLTLPILLWVFQMFAPVSPLANALAIPMVSVLITPLVLLSTLCLFLNEHLALFLLQIAHFLLNGLIQFLNACAQLPVFQNAISFVWMLVGLLGVGVVLLPCRFKGRWLGGFLILPVFLDFVERPLPNEAWIDFLDVGQGLAVLVRTQNHQLLFDAGPKYSSDSTAAERVILPFLKKNNMAVLNKVVLSHEDEDHIGGFLFLKNKVTMQEIVASFGPFQPCLSGQNWQWDGVYFSFLSPFSTLNEKKISKNQKNHALSVDKNARSCVLKIEAGGKSVLLTADITQEEELALTQMFSKQLKTDVLQLAHHGSQFSSTNAFLQATQPEFAVVSAGFENRYHHPHELVLKRMKEAKIKLYRTDLMGQIQVILKAQSVEVKSLREEKRRFWHKKSV